MPRQSAEFEWENSDGGQGYIDLSWGPMESWFDDDGAVVLEGDPDFPMMLSLEGPWMGQEDIERFIKWLQEQYAVAKLLHGRNLDWCNCGAKTPQGEYHASDCPANQGWQ